jgi:hypothetical protein
VGREPGTNTEQPKKQGRAVARPFLINDLLLAALNSRFGARSGPSVDYIFVILRPESALQLFKAT